MEQQIENAMGKLLGEQMADQAKADKAQRAQMEQLSQQTAAARGQLLEGFLNPEPEQTYPPEVQAIANALTAQPRLVPAVDKFLKRAVARINSAVDEALDDLLPPEEATNHDTTE